MPLNNKVLVLSLLLAGCGGRGGHEALPYIATPPAGGQQTGYQAGDDGAQPTYGQPAYGQPAYAGAQPAYQAYTPSQPSYGARQPVASVDQAAPADMPQGAGPRGTSGQPDAYDTVGYAGLYQGAQNGATITVAHATLAPGSFVELTALDSGHTIIALVTDRSSSGRIVELSPGAAQQLGVGDGAAVRIRAVLPSTPDQMALRSGQAASPRIDAPEALLKGLRHRLPAYASAPPPRRAPTPVRAPAPVRAPTSKPGARYAPPPLAADEADAAPADSGAVDLPPARGPSRAAAPAVAGSGFLVQVGAFSTRERAQSVARETGARIAVAGGIFRVQMGPYANAAAAQRARDEAARRGYGDARVLHIP